MKNLTIHPFLFAILPIISIFVGNVETITANVVFIQIIVMILVITTLLLVLLPICGNLKLAGLGATLAVFLLYSLAPISRALPNIDAVLVILGLVFVFITLTFFLRKTFNNWNTINDFLNLVSMTAFVIVLVPFFKFKLLEKPIWPAHQKHLIEISNKPLNALLKNKPNIFYFLLDGYARSDILREVFSKSNEEFINAMRTRGFFVAGNSRANYTFTSQSTASTFNMRYLNGLSEYMGVDSQNKRPYASIIKNNEVVEYLKTHGYKSIAVSSGYEFTEFRSFDRYISDPLGFSELSQVLLQRILPSQFSQLQYEVHRKRIKFSLGQVKNILKESSPFFSFIHLLSPHAPFVFKEDGEPVNPKRSFSIADGSHFISHGGSKKEYLNSYPQQLSYISTQMLKTVDLILKQSSSPPIIIIHSDHGPGFYADWQSIDNNCFRERLSSFVAVYTPEGAEKLISSEINLVNLFRSLFSFELLADKSFFTQWDKPYNFIEVTDRMETPCG